MVELPHATRTAALGAALVLVCVGAPPANGSVGEDPHRVVRGMTLSCPGAGRIWGSDLTVEAMRELKGLGINWVTIHPYAQIHADGTVGGDRMDGMYADPTWLTRPIEEAHRLGLKIMIKPHLAYWGSPFAWRGEIRFESVAAWRRFFETYERWIVRVAALSRDADAFVVGTELDQTSHHEASWRRIVDAVRGQTSAPLTYSAGWDTFEQVPFWDALDVIGIQAYFPLVDHEGLPTPAELDDGWARVIERLERFADRHGRRIVFGELGYNDSVAAAVRPWEYRRGGPDAVEVQRRALTAALRAIDASDRIVGAFLWKWFPGNTSPRGNFLKSTPAMRAVIAAHWSAPKGE